MQRALPALLALKLVSAEPAHAIQVHGGPDTPYTGLDNQSTALAEALQAIAQETAACEIGSGLAELQFKRNEDGINERGFLVNGGENCQAALAAQDPLHTAGWINFNRQHRIHCAWGVESSSALTPTTQAALAGKGNQVVWAQCRRKVY